MSPGGILVRETNVSLVTVGWLIFLARHRSIKKTGNCKVANAGVSLASVSWPALRRGQEGGGLLPDSPESLPAPAG